MIIKITEIGDGFLGTFDAKVVTGTRLDDGAELEKKFFANNRKLADELADFGVGDNMNIKMAKKPGSKFWDITGFESPSAAMIEKVTGAGNPGNGAGGGGGTAAYKPANKAAAGGGKSGGLSKEEWAEKDRKMKIGMSIHNGIAAAAQVSKVGTSPAKLIEYATELLPFLMLTELPGSNVKTQEETAGDGLNPPE